MNVNFKLDGDQFKKAGKVGWRITKAVVVTGIKGIAVQTAVKTINTTFEQGPTAIPKFDLDYVIGPEKEKVDKPKRQWFGKKKEIEEIVDEVVENKLEETLEEAKKLIEEDKK